MVEKKTTKTAKTAKPAKPRAPKAAKAPVSKASVSERREKEKAEAYKKILTPCAFISATEHLGTAKLREKIQIEAKKLGKDKVKVGVLGYPNVGKSSLINAIKGKHSAPTSSFAQAARYFSSIPRA